MKGLSQNVFIALFSMVLLSSLKAADSIDVSLLPMEVITTVSEVLLEENDYGDLKRVTVFADNDVRLLRVSPSEVEIVRTLMDARRNGWEVLLKLEDRAPESLRARDFVIVGVEVLSRENKLTSGLLYTPSKGSELLILDTVDEVIDLFESLYHYSQNFYDVNDNCFNRAHYWARSKQYQQFKRGFNQRTEKAFIFFSRAYIEKYDHNWWYHVAPMIYLNTDSEKLPVVFDPTFIEQPVTLEGWLSMFDSNTDGKCERINSLNDYYRNNHRPVCMYIVSSMYSYVPSDLNHRPLRNWRCSDFSRVRSGIPAPGTHTHSPNITWSDPLFDFLVPSECRGW